MQTIPKTMAETKLTHCPDCYEPDKWYTPTGLINHQEKDHGKIMCHKCGADITALNLMNLNLHQCK